MPSIGTFQGTYEVHAHKLEWISHEDWVQWLRSCGWSVLSAFQASGYVAVDILGLIRPVVLASEPCHSPCSSPVPGVIMSSRHAWIGTQSTRRVFATFDILRRWTIQLFNETASSIEVDSQYWRRNSMAENTTNTQTRY